MPNCFYVCQQVCPKWHCHCRKRRTWLQGNVKTRKNVMGYFFFFVLCVVLLGDKKWYYSRQEVSTVISKWCAAVGTVAMPLLLSKCRGILPDFLQANHHCHHHHRCSLMLDSGRSAWCLASLDIGSGEFRPSETYSQM